MNVIKVSANSRTAAVAGAIAGVMRENRIAEVQSIGAKRSSWQKDISSMMALISCVSPNLWMLKLMARCVLPSNSPFNHVVKKNCHKREKKQNKSQPVQNKSRCSSFFICMIEK